MKTIFNHNLVIKLVQNSASLVPGIKKVNIDVDSQNTDENTVINVSVWFEHKFFSIKSISYELQKKIFFNLSKQLDDTKIKINIIVHHS